jgi:hypothetical protein
MVSQPACLCVKHPSGAKTRFLCLSVSGLLIWGALSDKWPGLSFTVCVGPCSTGIIRSKSHRTHVQILLSDSRLPQPGGAGPSIYIPQEQGGPVIPPSIWFPFRRLLRLTGLQWMYSRLPPRGVSCIAESESELLCNWRFTVN